MPARIKVASLKYIISIQERCLVESLLFISREIDARLVGPRKGYGRMEKLLELALSTDDNVPIKRYMSDLIEL